MNPTTPPEAWLRGPLPGIDPLLLPAAHALVQEREDIAAAVAGASDADLWTRPGGAASAGFHLRHLAGSLDRLQLMSTEPIALPLRDHPAGSVAPSRGAPGAGTPPGRSAS